jgi:two-component system cell cycle response regulator
MQRLVHATLAFRGIVRNAHGLLGACWVAVYVVLGGATAEFGIVQCATIALWAALVVKRLRSKLIDPEGKSLLVDIDLGTLLTVGLQAALIRYDGGLNGRLSPSIYVFIALVSGFARPLAGIAIVLCTLTLELALRFLTLGESGWAGFLTHAGFVGAFAVLDLALLRAEVLRVRTIAKARVLAQLARFKEDARCFRLLGAGGRANPDDEHCDRAVHASVEEIHQSVHYALELLRRSLDLHTAVLLWLNDAGTHFRISELSTSSDCVCDTPFRAGDGVLGAVVSQRAKVSLAGLPASIKIPYYDRPCGIRALSAVPVLDRDTLRGVLAVDRIVHRGLTPHEEEILAQAARFCLRAIQNERVFLQLERAKVEQGKLYRAAQAFGAAWSEKDVVDAGVKAAREIASFDVAAVTVFDEGAKMHEVVAGKSSGRSIDDLVGMRFSHNTGLVSMVVQNRCPLPYRGDFDSARQIVLSRRIPWPNLPSLLVLPLLVHDKPLGTLILGAARRHAFGEAVRPTLEVLASHLAVSLSNARMVHKLETMATTDGLTGLLNKRTLMEAAEQKLAAAARFERKLSALIVDLDLFKKVNDTHGHDVGDIVIRGLADILKRQKRTTDVVARFGGEEFVVLCEQTDEQGAMLLAERIRDELGKTVFRTRSANVAITCSVGLATFPEAGRSWESLFKAADEALYASKRSGRNRCTAWRAARKTRSPQKAG